MPTLDSLLATPEVQAALALLRGGREAARRPGAAPPGYRPACASPQLRRGRSVLTPGRHLGITRRPADVVGRAGRGTERKSQRRHLLLVLVGQVAEPGQEGLDHAPLGLAVRPRGGYR
jgi:hypothetical protein